MSIETLHAFDQNDVGIVGSAFSNTGASFTYSSSNAANVVVLEDPDGDGSPDGDTTFDDQSSFSGQTEDDFENLVSFNGDTTYAGNDWSSFATYTVTGSDGSSFDAYIIGRDVGNTPTGIDGGDFTDNMYIAFTQPLTDGVTYTYSNYSYIGQVEYGAIADQTYIHCFVRGTLIETDRGEVAI